MAHLPISIATPKRSFSCLKRIKRYPRHTAGQERFNGLTSVNIHKDVDLSIDEIFEEFLKKPRIIL